MAPSMMERSTIPAPFVVKPTNEWDGDDGNWSSFAISVGTPPQYFRVLPSTSSPDITLPVEEGCQGILQYLPNCGGLRGGEDGNPYLRNNSTTWSLTGLYQVFRQQTIFNDTGVFGTDNVTIGNGASSTNATVKTQTVIGVSQEDFWLGTVGLNSKSSSFNGFVTPSFISQLKNQSVIPSLSYGYMAGQYYNNKLAGSLILGGYDQSKVDSAIVTSPVNTDKSPPSIDISVASITASNTLSGSTRGVLSSAVTATIDTSVNQIWLPNATCDALADSFGLTWNSTLNHYVVNDTIHSTLKSKNPSITFRLGGQDVGSEINIVLKYNALDLSLTPPLNESSQAYFPIQRSNNDSQITLGRAFMQEAYLVVDWERNNFTISSLANPTGSPNILAITPPSISNSSSSNTTSGVSASSSPDSSSSSGISGGAIGGIVVGVIAALAIIAGFAFWFWRRRRQQKIDARKSVETQPPAYDEGAEFYGTEGKPSERPPLKSAHVSEMGDSSVPRAELTSDNVQRLEEIAAQRELDGTPIVPVGELEGATPGSELGELEGAAVGSELETISNRPESSITRADRSSVASPERRSVMSPARQSLASPERARSPLAGDSSVFELE